MHIAISRELVQVLYQGSLAPLKQTKDTKRSHKCWTQYARKESVSMYGKNMIEEQCF